MDTKITATPLLNPEELCIKVRADDIGSALDAYDNLNLQLSTEDELFILYKLRNLHQKLISENQSHLAFYDLFALANILLSKNIPEGPFWEILKKFTDETSIGIVYFFNSDTILTPGLFKLVCLYPHLADGLSGYIPTGYLEVLDCVEEFGLLDRDTAVAINCKPYITGSNFVLTVNYLNKLKLLNKATLLAFCKSGLAYVNFISNLESLNEFKWFNEKILLAIFENGKVNVHYSSSARFLNGFDWMTEEIRLDLFKNKHIDDDFFQMLISFNESDLVNRDTAAALCRNWSEAAMLAMVWLKEEIDVLNKDTILSVCCDSVDRASYVSETLACLKKEFSFNKDFLKKIALIVLKDAEYANGFPGCYFDMVSIFRFLKNKDVDLFSDENIDAICNTAKYSVGMSAAFTILKHYRKLDQNNFDIICKNPAKAVLLATQLGGKIPDICSLHPGVVEYLVTSAAKIMAWPSSNCLFSFVPKEVRRQMTSYLGNENLGQKHRDKIAAYFDGPSPAEKISNAIQPILLQRENYKIKSVDLSSGAIKIRFNSPEAAIFFYKKCHEINNIFHLIYDPSQPNHINMEDPQMIKNFISMICQLDFDAFCQEYPEFQVNHSKSAGF